MVDKSCLPAFVNNKIEKENGTQYMTINRDLTK